MNTINTKKILLAAALASGATFATAQVQTPSDTPQATTVAQEEVRAEMSQLENEFREVAGKLQKLEQKALQKEKVAEARDEFQDLLTENIVEKNPDLEPKVKERAELAKHIDDYKAGKELPEDKDVSEIYSKYNSLHQEIMPVEQQVMQDPEIQQAYRSFQQQLLTSMQEIDDKTQEYMVRQNELRESYQELVRQIQG